MTARRVLKALAWTAFCGIGGYELSTHPQDLTVAGAWLGMATVYAIGLAWVAIGRPEERI